MSTRDRVAQAQADIAWLERQGAAEGVAAIIAERRRQIEAMAWSRSHDDIAHTDGWLGWQAGVKAILGSYMVQHDPFGNKDSTDEFAESGAMAAAEIDRIEALG